MGTINVKSIDKEAGLTQYDTANGRRLRVNEEDARVYRLGEAERAPDAKPEAGAKAGAAPANKSA